MNYAYWLSNIEGIGIRTIQRMLRQTGSAEELYFMEERQLKSLGGLGEKELESLLKSRKKDVEGEYEKLQEKGITFLSMEDEAYPKKLKNIVDAPYGLYLKGKLPPEETKTVAIVGARMCSEYGYAAAQELGRKLTEGGACVISGMAKGIDSAGHRGALDAGIAKGCSTVAVLGNGVDICYPAANRSLYEKIIETGGIVSEYPPGTQPIAGFFPARNRIIAGLCDVLVVVEAKTRSGSLITVDFALEQGKDIYAVPGRIYDALSQGCNALIRQGAGIISEPEEFLKELELGISGEGTQLDFKKLLLEKEESLVYSCVDLRPKSIEEILNLTGLDMPKMSGILASLVQKDYITETFKNCYVRKI